MKIEHDTLGLLRCASPAMQEAADRAEELASDVSGVLSVLNEIEVRG